MKNHLIFFQGGGGEDDYNADGKLVASLKTNLGAQYSIHYPLLDTDDTPDLGRRKQIGHALSSAPDDVILVGHSFGASMLLVYLSENVVRKKIKGIFLLSTPFWQGTEDWVTAYKLQSDFADRLDRTVPLFFYHSRDDEDVPVDHFRFYQQKIPWAMFREIPTGGHQLNNDLALVANDIKSI